MLGQSLDETFTYDEGTIFLLWQGKVPTVIDPSQLKAGDRITVRVRAARAATLAAGRGHRRRARGRPRAGRPDDAELTTSVRTAAAAAAGPAPVAAAAATVHDRARHVDGQPAREGLVAQRSHGAAHPDPADRRRVRVARDQMRKPAVEQLEGRRTGAAAEVAVDGAGGQLYEHAARDERLEQLGTMLHLASFARDARAPV